MIVFLLLSSVAITASFFFFRDAEAELYASAASSEDAHQAEADKSTDKKPEAGIESAVRLIDMLVERGFIKPSSSQIFRQPADIHMGQSLRVPFEGLWLEEDFVPDHDTIFNVSTQLRLMSILSSIEAALKDGTPEIALGNAKRLASEIEQIERQVRRTKSES